MQLVGSSDGVEIAVHDLGGSGDRDLVVVHATGFCARTYGPLVDVLGARLRCWGVDLRGHGLSRAPDGLDYQWRGFADDVLAAVAALGLRQPAALGHSSGGAAVLAAEAARPGTFSALWCYEPIVWPEPDKARARAAALAEGAGRRRDRFASAAEAVANFGAKPPLSGFAPEVVDAYVEHAFGPGPDGSLTLRCRPEVEAAIYLQAPEGDRFADLGRVGCPVVVACGGRSDAVGPELAARLAAAISPGPARTRVFERLGHFGPFESPAEVATAALADLS
ncbi:MAG: alpha/beta hydrolase [Actinomycetota bacterium]